MCCAVVSRMSTYILYIFNLREFQKKSGDLARMEWDGYKSCIQLQSKKNMEDKTSNRRYILAEFNTTNDLLQPIIGFSRIKYTCVAVCRQFVAFGASTGGLYIFHRESSKYLQVLANKEGFLTHIAFAPNENLLALSTRCGTVAVWELTNIEKRTKAERLTTSLEHKDTNVTALLWDYSNSKVFVGDEQGKVTAVNVPTSKAAGLFQIPTELILNGDSKINQLDSRGDLLLVSTLTKCYVCNTSRLKFWTVGKKSREGEYGACFIHNAAKKTDLIYSARPGSRIWEADTKGNVLKTHQFKHMLAIPSTPVCGIGHWPVFTDDDSCLTQSVAFPRLIPVKDRYLLSWTHKGLYVFDPSTVEVLLWTSDIQDVAQIAVYNTDIYCLYQNSKIQKLNLIPVEKCIGYLTTKQLWLQCAQLCCHFDRTLLSVKKRKYVPVSMVKDIIEHLRNNGETYEEFEEKLTELVNQIEHVLESGSISNCSSRRSSVSSCDIIRMDSGIYKVNPSKVNDFTVDLEAHNWSALNCVDDEDPCFDDVALVAMGTDELLNDANKLEDLKEIDMESWFNCTDNVAMTNNDRACQEQNKTFDDDHRMRENLSLNETDRLLNTGEGYETVIEFSEPNLENSELMTSAINIEINNLDLEGDLYPVVARQQNDDLEESVKDMMEISLGSSPSKDLDSADILEDVELSENVADESKEINYVEITPVICDDIVDVDQKENLEADSVISPNIEEHLSTDDKNNDDNCHTELVDDNQQEDFAPVYVSSVKSHSKKHKRRRKKKINPAEIISSLPQLNGNTEALLGNKLPSSGPINNLQEVQESQSPRETPSSEQIISVSPSPSTSQPLPGNLPALPMVTRKSPLSSPTRDSRQAPAKNEIPTTKRNSTISSLPDDDVIQLSSSSSSSTASPSVPRRFLSHSPVSSSPTRSPPKRSVSDPFRQSPSSPTQPSKQLPTSASSNIAHPSPLPSPSSSPKSTSISMVTYMGVPYPSASSAKIPSLSAVKDSISSKISKTKAFFHIHTGHNESGNLANRPTDLWMDSMPKSVVSQEEKVMTTLDLTDLIKATRDAKVAFTDIATLLDPKNTKDVLTRWLQHLDIAQDQINGFLIRLPENENRDVKGIYNVSEGDLKHIRELATSCFDLQVFGSITQKLIKDKMEDITMTTHNILPDDVETVKMRTDDEAITGGEREAFEHDDENEDDVDDNYLQKPNAGGDAPDKKTVQDEATEDELVISMDENPESVKTVFAGVRCIEDSKIHVTEDNEPAIHLTEENEPAIHLTKDNDHHDEQILDYQSAMFIHRFKYWLDFGQIRKILRLRNGPVCESWRGLLNAMHAREDAPEWLTNTDYKEVIKSNHQSRVHLLIYIDRLFKNDALIALDCCIHGYPLVHPSEVLRFCAEYDNSQDLIVQYLHKINGCEKRDQILADLCKDCEVRGQLLEYLLSHNTTENKSLLSCDCGMPRPEANQYIWPNEETMKTIIKSTVLSDHKEHILSICKKYSYWFGFITLSRHNLSKTDWLSYIVQLADVHLVHHLLTEISLSSVEWKLILELFQKMYQTDNDNAWKYVCLHCGTTLLTSNQVVNRTLTWQSLAELLVKYTGIQTSLELLQQVQVPENSLSVEFFQNCIFSATIDYHQRIIVHGILEKIDTYLWSKRTNLLHSSLMYSAMKEMRQSIAPSVGQMHDLTKANCDSLQLTMEETDIHWGISSKIDRDCVICGVSLSNPIHQMDSSVLVAKCGHIFHRRCLPGMICIICYPT
ncbi:uncharacterized protein LOC102809991 [Saccoglossus kowalevskii]|uniref:Uncharacterized protein LOC102809991 n=1 Tax=Saccoglossus kowalevskii TaxID=10224 RepID=A0ABM0LUZ4_SACKO|nr:PREDICTED: uncharacterized protein LOC102809991 [Saccoglossus kowalevskii]